MPLPGAEVSGARKLSIFPVDTPWVVTATSESHLCCVVSCQCVVTIQKQGYTGRCLDTGTGKCGLTSYLTAQLTGTEPCVRHLRTGHGVIHFRNLSLISSSPQPQSLGPERKSTASRELRFLLYSGLQVSNPALPPPHTQHIPQAAAHTPPLERVCSIHPHGPAHRQHRDGSNAQLLYVSFTVTPDSWCKCSDSSTGPPCVMCVLCKRTKGTDYATSPICRCS